MWIDVKDRLPDRDMDVVTYSGYFQVRIGRLSDGDFWFIDGQSLPQRITHWQPLPLPPNK